MSLAPSCRPLADTVTAGRLGAASAAAAGAGAVCAWVAMLVPDSASRVAKATGWRAGRARREAKRWVEKVWVMVVACNKACAALAVPTRLRMPTRALGAS